MATHLPVRADVVNIKVMAIGELISLGYLIIARDSIIHLLLAAHVKRRCAREQVRMTKIHRERASFHIPISKQ